jgi:hypothetical protein
MQRLTVSEKEALQDWILELVNWNRPIQVKQVQSMAVNLLVEKGDINNLSVY